MVTITNSIVKDCSLTSSFILATTTDMTLVNNTFTNITSSGENTLIYILEAALKIQNLTYTQSTCEFLNSLFSLLNVNRLTIDSVTTNLEIIKLREIAIGAYDGTGTFLNSMITNSVLSNINTQASNVISVVNSMFLTISNFTMSGCNSTALRLQGSMISTFENLKFSNNKY